MRLLVSLVLLASCARPATDWNAKADPIPTVATPSAPSSPTEASPQPPSAWVPACKKHLEAAALAAAKHSPALGGLVVETRVFDDGDGAHVEELSMSQLGFALHVSRRTKAETGDDGWKMRAESLKGSYHRAEHRIGPKGSAFLSFDGVPVPAATALSPIFRHAADLCLDA